MAQDDAAPGEHGRIVAVFTASCLHCAHSAVLHDFLRVGEVVQRLLETGWSSEEHQFGAVPSGRGGWLCPACYERTTQATQQPS